jgi:hypothetical protein
MKTKIQSLKKVSFFTILLIFFIFNSRAYSQIIYTDIVDATPSVTYPLDLNNDTINDFMIQMGGSAGNIGVMCKPLNNNAYSGELVSGVYLPWALSPGYSICDTLVTWYDSSKIGTMAFWTTTGNWIGQNDKYLALKLIVGTNTYYGWARLDVVATSSSFTVKDYAYNSIPNACLQSGQTTLGININRSQKSFSVFPNPCISTTTIHTNDNLIGTALKICNVYGQTVKQVNNILEQSIVLSRENLPSGLYFIQLIKENKIIAADKLVIAE